METVVGLEIHLNLLENNMKKCFSYFKEIELIQHQQYIDRGLPGTMPRINKYFVEKAIKACIALNCKKLAKYLIFDRKIYMYPDLSVNYQITQKRCPLGKNGKYFGFTIDTVHMESDAAATKDNQINLERLNTPLIEITTKPQKLNLEELICFLKNLQVLMAVNKISSSKFSEGLMRFDLNLSKDTYYRAEFKNINGFEVTNKCIKWYEENYNKFPMYGKGMTVNVHGDLFEISRKKTKYCFTSEPDLYPIRIYTDSQIIFQLKYSILEKKYEKKILIEPNLNQNLLRLEQYITFNIEKCPIYNFRLDDCVYSMVNARGTECYDMIRFYFDFNCDKNWVELCNMRKDLDIERCKKVYKMFKTGYLLKKHFIQIKQEFIDNFDLQFDQTKRFLNMDFIEVMTLDVNKYIICYQEIIRKNKSKNENS